MNRPCKKFLRKSYLTWKMKVVHEKRAAGVRGRIVVKIDREQLMTWTEYFVNDFNHKENIGQTNIIIPCLGKVGQNIFNSDDDAFTTWLESLNKNALYKALLDAHTATVL